MRAFEDLTLLRSFVSIVECGSISAGARRLRISQPTLSRQLRTLEELCGTALLRRDTHQMSMTETGQRLLADAQALLDHAEAAGRRLHADHTTLSGQLHLFATMDLGQWIVTPLVSRFLQANPKITATLALNNRPLHMIQEGCDVGIVPGRITDESVIARPVGVIRLHLAASPALVKNRPEVKRLSDLQSWPWISLSGSHFWGGTDVTLYDSKGGSHTLPTTPVLISEGVTSIREAVRDGLGVALLPDWLVENDLKSGAIVPVLPRLRAKDLPLHVVYAGQRILPARVSAFIDFAVRYLADAGSNSSFKGNG
ncbi:DNA-binding transcriptional LysR family regulator [Prosthecobacter fusiformis]|uniref:DNA-binding transcriptional LysR family regulator n=1 Tax=Prosthecobacter fusiformis TaxID=48464 RepID=A0A4R7RJR5_9BACT|nr:LysR family transcriptional regulator [Prosthecobacter fusiformis]TDU63146.1 DNA-binding transcriptional LysR family regulator [Prosthecobacter fusiformis]